LIKENDWEYSAPPIPTSHWTGLGFDEVYIECMEDLVDEIRKKTSTIREEGGYMDYITLGVESPGNDDDTVTFLLYDNGLLPHWKELATALQLCQSNNIDFTIQNVQLTPSVTDVLIPAFKGKLKELFLDNNEFADSREGIEFILTCMEINHQMKEFYLSNNQLGGMENALSVLDAIIRHPSIERVRLENCLGGDINGYDALCYLLASGKSFEFECIDIERNNIHTMGGTAIPDYIARNPPLRTLLLSDNKLNDEDATFIARALKQNTNLKNIYLYGNDITNIGKEALSKAMYDPTSLNTVYDCNHTCQIVLDVIVRKDLPDWCRNAGYTDPKTIRCMKMHYILSLRHREGSNVQHLNTEFDEDEDGDDTSLSLKIVPKVLEAVSKHSKNEHHDCRPPLSIMYEILRGWKMPELYGNR